MIYSNFAVLAAYKSALIQYKDADSAIESTALALGLSEADVRRIVDEAKEAK